MSSHLFLAPNILWQISFLIGHTKISIRLPRKKHNMKEAVYRELKSFVAARYKVEFLHSKLMTDLQEFVPLGLDPY